MANSYYTPSGNPLTRSASNSAQMRAEFAAIQGAFDRLPNPAVGQQGFTGGYFSGPNIVGMTATTGLVYDVTLYARILGAYVNAATFATPNAALTTVGNLGVFRSSKGTAMYSLAVHHTDSPLDDDYLMFDRYHNVIFGNGTSAFDKTSTDGFLMIPRCNGAPTGTPAHLYNSSSPILFDYANNKLYVYNGSAWKGVTLS